MTSQHESFNTSETTSYLTSNTPSTLWTDPKRLCFNFLPIMMAMMASPSTPIERGNSAEPPDVCTSSEESSATLVLAEAAAKSCQQLAERLKRKDSGKNKHVKVQKVPSNPVEMDIEKIQEELQKCQLAQEENIRLRAVIQDVTEANKRWQKYNQERQTYMQKLMDTIRELKNKMKEESNSGSNLAISPPDVTSEEYALLQLNYEKVMEENRKLQRQLDESRRKITHLSSIVSKTKSDNGEHIELLQMQVRAHRDDWEAEREEKKNILKRESRMQDQLNEAKAKIKDLQRELHHRSSCPCHMRNGLHTEPIVDVRRSAPPAYNIPLDSRLVPRSPGVRPPYQNPYQYELFDDELATDGAASPTPLRREIPTSSSSHNNSNVPNQTRTRDSLKCPECAATFSAGNHQDFLEHFEICQTRALQL